MAQTIKQIQDDMSAALADKGLSTSKAAEWRLWTYIIAVAINAFEIILDLFRKEIEEATDKIVSTTERWYVEMCYRFQNGHKLIFNDDATAGYAVDDPAARIIKVAAINVVKDNNKIIAKVAKLDDNGKITPLTADELYNFEGYMAVIKAAGDQVTAVSTTADLIRYNMDVYYDPAVPKTTVHGNLVTALDEFKTIRSFDAQFYPQRLIEAIMNVDGVVTVDLKKIERQGADTGGEYIPVGVVTELQSGYYDFSDDSLFELKSSKQ